MMAKYLLIESRDSYEFGDVGYFCGMAKDLAAAGNDVTLFLLQNGVLMARKGAETPARSLLTSESKVRVLADAFCLRERGIPESALLPGVKVGDVDALVDLLATQDVKAVWH